MAFRYIVQDVDQAVKFYVDAFGFELKQQYGPAMAILERSDMTIWLAGPPASASQPLSDGSRPEPGGWNRIVIGTSDMDATIATLEALDVTFRGDVITGPVGRQVLCNDPSGNPVEVFESS